MPVLVGIALKSLLIAGITLALLALMKRRSAAERSWVAHIGLLALVIMAFAPLALPRWNVETPAMFAQAPVIEQITPTSATHAPFAAVVSKADAAPVIAAPARSPVNLVAVTTALYAVPAALLLFITLLALARLITLRARAEVLVDGHWLSALARAQRRMGFKHGTALLTSNELASPISWGLMRPVILLNNRAVEASSEAEAIIAHELAHVARMDWAKLLLARVSTALFWFNPLVWLLAREAHQLREEAADDAVLAADIPDTDYAQLLVGVARHDCPSLLLGAHGVAPSKSSLSRRVARVLDSASARAPVARSFALGVFVGAVAIAAPLAALTLTPKSAATNAASAVTPVKQGAAGWSDTAVEAVPADLPSIISQGVATSVHSAVAAVNRGSEDFEAVSPTGARVKSTGGTLVASSPSGSTVTVYPPDASGRRKMVAVSASGATAVTYAAAGDAVPGLDGTSRRHDSAIDSAIAMKAVGATPEYVAAVRAASPRLRTASIDDIIGMKAVGVTPEYIRDLVSAGLANLDADDLAGARAVGLDAGYVRAMAAAGYRGNVDDYVKMRAVGINPAFAQQVRSAGYKNLDIDELVELRTLGLGGSRAPPEPPRPPRPPRAPRDENDGG